MKRFNQLVAPNTLIPVAVIEDPDSAVGAAEALLAGGVKAIEVTLRTANALAAVEQIARNVPDICLGVGTLTTADNFRRAADAGAQFLVSPGLTPTLASASESVDLPYIPGIATVSEIIQAREFGFNLLKFFPAELLGGVATLRHFASLFPKAEFCPTGGVNQNNVGNYLAEPNVTYAGGSWLTPQKAIAARDWAAITEIASAALRLLARSPN